MNHEMRIYFILAENLFQKININSTDHGHWIGIEKIVD